MAQIAGSLKRKSLFASLPLVVTVIVVASLLFNTIFHLSFPVILIMSMLCSILGVGVWEKAKEAQEKEEKRERGERCFHLAGKGTYDEIWAQWCDCPDKVDVVLGEPSILAGDYILTNRSGQIVSVDIVQMINKVLFPSLVGALFAALVTSCTLEELPAYREEERDAVPDRHRKELALVRQTVVLYFKDLPSHVIFDFLAGMTCKRPDLARAMMLMWRMK